MRDAALKAGLKNFKPTSAGDTYRTYESQLAAFNTRYSLTPTEYGTRTFEGKKYYKKAANLADLAAPGSSNHNLGLAVDISEASGARLEWLIANEHLYGFSHELQSEPWHIRLVCGDRIPKAVLDYELDQALPEIVKPN
jgi:LAS superfamily LD-carboxypeptidase LdcB